VPNDSLLIDVKSRGTFRPGTFVGINRGSGNKRFPGTHIPYFPQSGVPGPGVRCMAGVNVWESGPLLAVLHSSIWLPRFQGIRSAESIERG